MGQISVRGRDYARAGEDGERHVPLARCLEQHVGGGVVFGRGRHVTPATRHRSACPLGFGVPDASATSSARRTKVSSPVAIGSLRRADDSKLPRSDW